MYIQTVVLYSHIAIVRNISINHLPFHNQLKLRENYQEPHKKKIHDKIVEDNMHKYNGKTLTTYQ